MGCSRTLKGELINFPPGLRRNARFIGRKLLSSASDEPSSPESDPEVRDAHAHRSRAELGTERA